MPLLCPDQLEDAAALLRAGRLVAMPTETVYGLAADAMNRRAVARIFERKGRPRFDPLIVHVISADEAFALATHVPAAARQLAEAFWPGPLTLVLPKVERIDGIVTAGLDTVALRVPDHELALRLIRAVGSPLAAPSANRFGGISPTTPQHVLAELGDDLPVLDGGTCPRGVESTVVAFEGDRPTVLRLGSVPLEQIEAVVGHVIQAASTDRPGAPGMLSRHYAPRTPLVIVDEWTGGGPGVGALSLADEPDGYGATERLSCGADLTEAAANLFAAMRRLDEAGLVRIEARLVPERGLGRAINDRLRRAAHPPGR